MTGDDTNRELPFGSVVSGPLPPSIYKGKPPVGISGFTSKAGSRAIEPVSGSLRQRVYDYILKRGDDGATDQQGARDLQMNVVSYGPRRRELVKLGYVAFSGRTRATISNVEQKIWVATKRASQ